MSAVRAIRKEVISQKIPSVVGYDFAATDEKEKN
jgi:hypothetical protein